jgi:hypothetical protein
VPQAALITRRDLLNHGASSDFLERLKIRPIEVQISTGGSLGTMTVAWRPQGATGWSRAEQSEPGGTWTWDTPDPGYASATFPAAVYTAGHAWTIATDGSVTPQGAAPAGPTAVRNDVVAAIIAGVTSDFVTWAQPRCVPPIVSIGEGQKGWAAAIAVYRLKSREGMTPTQAGTGDENQRARALDAELNIKGIGASAMRPPDIVDSSPGGGGTGIPQFARSRSSRGFEDY